MVNILYTKPLVERLQQQIKTQVQNMDTPPRLHVILVGENQASRLYVKRKQNAAQNVGIVCTIHYLPEDTQPADLNKFIQNLNNDDEVSGILLQLPVPQHIDGYEALNLISPQKDVDGLTISNKNKLLSQEGGLRPATPLGVMRILKWHKTEISGKNIVVLGESPLVGAPIAEMLKQANGIVKTFNSGSDLEEKETAMKQADIIISAAGYPSLVRKDNISNNVTIIDVGINHKNGQLVGDVDTNLYTSNTGITITPVPGGVGPMTVVSLLTNVIDAYHLQNNMPIISWLN